MEKIHYIFSENPYQKIWDTFMFFENEPNVKNFLIAKYNNINYKESKRYAFLNTAKFIYFIKQAREYFYSANSSNILVKPLLIYYGMMNLIKAVILTKDPMYPNKTSVLRHGITTRKLKKTNYSFHEDEIKIQKEGLLPWFYTTMTNNSINKIEGNKYIVRDLLALLPELYESYNRLFNEQTIFPISMKQRNSNEILISLPKLILNLYKDKEELIFILNHLSSEQSFFLEQKDDNYLHILLKSTIESPLNYANFINHPLFTQDIKGKYYYRHISEVKYILPDIMVEYMLMYNLGMLCRYETELWGEIIFSFASKDMYIINELVNITQRKFPNIILNKLFNEFLIFKSN